MQSSETHRKTESHLVLENQWTAIEPETSLMPEEAKTEEIKPVGVKPVYA